MLMYIIYACRCYGTAVRLGFGELAIKKGCLLPLAVMLTANSREAPGCREATRRSAVGQRTRCTRVVGGLLEDRPSPQSPHAWVSRLWRPAPAVLPGTFGRHPRLAAGDEGGGALADPALSYPLRRWSG